MGILLATILLTVIVVLFSSYKTSLIETIIKETGSWHAVIVNDSDNAIFNSLDDKINNYVRINDIGYSAIENALDEDKPYLHISAMSSNVLDMLPLNIIEGNYPENEDEILLPSAYTELYGVSVGDQITLNIGLRRSGTEIRWQNSSYLGETQENIDIEETYKYTVSGISETVSFIEYGMSPGYTAVILNSTGEATKTYIELNNYMDANEIINSNIITNKDLLDILGGGDGESIGKIYKALLTTLIVIVFLISFILINNSYMITKNERDREYSLLTSLGVDRKQLLILTLFENMFLGLIIIPIGMGVSILFLHVFLNKIVYVLSLVSYDDIAFKLNLRFSLLSLLFIIGLFMILVSSAIPYLLNIRKTVLSGIRQNETVRIKKKNKGKSLKKLLKDNVELDLTYISYKRYKNKYKFTILSIVISIVLFISMNVFCAYGIKQINEDMDVGYDLYCNIHQYELDYSLNEIFPRLSSIQDVEESWWIIQDSLGDYSVRIEDINTSIKDYVIQSEIDSIPIYYYIVEDEIYNKLLTENGKNYSDYDNSINLKAPAIAQIINYSEEEERSYRIFQENEANIDIQKTMYTMNTRINNLSLDFIQSIPKEISDYADRWGICVFLPMNMAAAYLSELPNSIKLLFSSSDHKNTYELMTETIEQNNWDFYAVDYAESFDKQLNTIKIIDIFAGAFMAVVIAISILNIFNTVFSNITGRRKEFAILTSIGMTDNSIKRLILTENIIIGAISLAIGVFITILISLFMKIIFEAKEFIYPVIPTLLIILAYSASIFIASWLGLKKNNMSVILDSLKKDFT
jgi:putative ABC transport system permease protein